jgi:hypothetical protein
LPETVCWIPDFLHAVPAIFLATAWAFEVSKSPESRTMTIMDFFGGVAGIGIGYLDFYSGLRKQKKM